MFTKTYNNTVPRKKSMKRQKSRRNYCPLFYKKNNQNAISLSVGLEMKSYVIDAC